MTKFCPSCQIPRAHIDPISDELTALALLTAVMEQPAEAQVIAVLVDGARRGHSILVVHGTRHPDAVIDVAEVIAQPDPDVEASAVAEVMLASVRPNGSLDHADGDRWLEISDILDARSIELLEWFVIGTTVACPRDLLGIPPRW